MSGLKFCGSCPEAGLWHVPAMGVFSNLRLAICFPALADASTPAEGRGRGLDLMIVRERPAGLHFGQPRGASNLFPDGQKRGVDTQVYTTLEIERVSRVAFELAEGLLSQTRSPPAKNPTSWRRAS